MSITQCKPQQQTLSIRVSESLREFLELSRQVIANGRGDAVSIPDSLAFGMTKVTNPLSSIWWFALADQLVQPLLGHCAVASAVDVKPMSCTGCWPKASCLEIMNARGVAMQITLELPEDIAQGMESKWKDLPRAALESLALEAYRSQAITAAQLRRLLAFETRMQVDAFLKEHELYDFTAADFEQDRETLRQLRVKEGQR